LSGKRLLLPAVILEGVNEVKALVLRSPEQLEIMDVPKPKLSAGQVLIKVSKCGICGSDVRYFHGENPWAKQTLGRHVDNPPNIILGHERTGVRQELLEVADSIIDIPILGLGNSHNVVVSATIVLYHILAKTKQI